MHRAALTARDSFFGDVVVELVMGEDLYSAKPKRGHTVIMFWSIVGDYTRFVSQKCNESESWELQLYELLGSTGN